MALKGQKDRRWKIEHAQIVSPEDFDMFDNIVPSVQPTHATSDMYWAKDRVGKERMKGAYAFKDLLKQIRKRCFRNRFSCRKSKSIFNIFCCGNSLEKIQTIIQKVDFKWKMF